MTTLDYNHDRKPVSGIKNLLNEVGHRVSVCLTNFSVAMAWANSRRANPADLKEAGLTKELEDHVIASTKIQYAE
jgi:beta-phosphoglucomutase-like phosphatase (HAD superfamily)